MELELLLDLETIESKGSNINALTLVGKILSDKKINFTAILSSSWNLVPNIIINAPNHNVISCTFKHAKERDKIIEMGHWAVKGSILNLQHWPL